MFSFYFKEKVQQISQTAHGKKMLSKLDEEGIKKLDAEQIAARESEELQRERKELQNRLKSQEKKIDYFERAKRLEEIPLFEKFLAEKEVKDREFWELQEQTNIENAIAERKDAVAQQERLKRMYVDRDAFLETLKSKRASLYEEKLRNFELELVEERKLRLAQRVEKRRMERRAAWLREKEEERFHREEEVRRKVEEEERAAAEARRKEREAEEEKRRIQYEKQRAKEEEADRKIQEDRERLAREDLERNQDGDKNRRAGGGMRGNERERGTMGGDWRRNNDRGQEQQRTIERAPMKELDNSGESWRTRGSAGAPAQVAAGPPTVRESESKWRRGGPNDEEREPPNRAPLRGDNRRGVGERDFRRENRRDRDEREPQNSAGNWRDNQRAPMERGEQRDNRRGPGVERGAPSGGERRIGGERDRNMSKDAGNWRTERPAPREEKERPAPMKREPAQSQPQTEKDKSGDDGEWTSVKRR